MIFKSEKVKSQWDTCIYIHEGIFHLFYVIMEQKDGQSYRDKHPDENILFEGIGTAISRDGVHFEDYGSVLEPSDKMVRYMGTGSPWKDTSSIGSRRFICNYSEYRRHQDNSETQHILFAWSEDLLKWHKYGEEFIFSPDSRFYEARGRWDCINVIEREHGGYWGMLTATPSGSQDLENGIGFGFSDDGLHWNALPPVQTQPPAHEAGAFIRHDGKLYALFGRDMCVYAYHADNIKGPYYEQNSDGRLLSAPHSYFARFFYNNNELLINHHSMNGIPTQRSIEEETYLAPIKKAVFDGDGNLRLAYWKGNEALKGKPIAFLRDSCKDIVYLTPSCDFQRGIILEGILAFEPGLTDILQLFIEADEQTFLIKIHQNRRLEMGDFSFQNKNFGIRQSVRRTLLKNSERLKYRLMLRRGMAEIYLDDYFMECWTLRCARAKKIRIWSPNIQSVIPTSIFEMNL